MQTRWFWNQWSKEYRLIGYGVAIFFFASLVFLWVNYFIGTDAVIHWQKLVDQKTVETVADTFQVGGFEFSVPVESYLSFEYFKGSNIVPNTFALHAFVGILIFSIVLILTVITTFKRFYYFIGTGLFILLVVLLRLEVLRPFGYFTQWTPVVVLLGYVPISFYFNAFSNARFITRLLIFIAITITFAVLIYFFSAVPYPFLHLAVTGYIPGLIIAILVTIMVAHEILASFIFLTSQGSTTSKSLNHFLIISVIYLANVMLVYLHEAHIVHWNFLYVNVYLLFTISVILGIWGYRKRESLYQHITYFNPFGAYFIAGLFIIAFATIAMLLGTGNDAALKIVRDFIIFSHLGFGFIFMLYFISNFMIMMADNLNAYKVLYNPIRMPYITYRIAGLIAMLAFVFYSNWREYVYHGTAGLYNSMGDLYTLIEKNVFAEAYYEKSKNYAFQNHHSNYALATIEADRFDIESAHERYQLASGRRPTEYSFINDANLYVNEEKIFKAIFNLRNATQVFPQSGVIKNNLGYAYTKIHLLDSALYLFDQARQDRESKDAAEMNFTAFIAQEYLPVKADSLSRLLNSKSTGVASNALVIATTQHQNFTPEINPLQNKLLDLFSATMLNNYMVNQLKNLDTTFTFKALQLANDSVNLDYREALKASLAYAFYYQNNTAKALEILAELAYLTQSRQGKYNYIMGLWALEQGNPILAAQSFDYAIEYSYKDAKVYRAIALTESHQTQKALIAIDTLLQSKRTEEVEIGKQLKNILTNSTNGILTQSDRDKYQYCRYQVKLNDSLTFNKVVNTIQDINLKVETLLDRSKRLFDNGNTNAAIRVFNKLEGLKLTDKNLFDRMQHFELELLASRGQLRLLAEKINEGITFSKSQQLEKMLYTAMIAEASGDTVTAAKNYSVLAVYNPFYEEGIIAAARYFKNHSQDSFKAYNILTNAMHVNKKSVRLLRAYIAEAARMGFDNYATDGEAELKDIEREEL